MPQLRVLAADLAKLGRAWTATRAQSTKPTTIREEIEKFTEKELPQIRPLYLDVQATTPMDPRVVDAMLPYMINDFGNPHSRTHAYGWESEAAVERARKQVKYVSNFWVFYF